MQHCSALFLSWMPFTDLNLNFGLEKKLLHFKVFSLKSKIISRSKIFSVFFVGNKWQVSRSSFADLVTAQLGYVFNSYHTSSIAESQIMLESCHKACVLLHQKPQSLVTCLVKVSILPIWFQSPPIIVTQPDQIIPGCCYCAMLLWAKCKYLCMIEK